MLREYLFGFKPGVSSRILIAQRRGNFSILQWDPSLSGITENPRIGLIGGTGVEFGFEKMALEIDVFYEQKGETLSVSDMIDGIAVEGKDSYKLDYLVFPVILKGVSKGEAVSVFYGAGLGIASLISAKDDWEITIGGTTISESADQKNYFKNSDFLGITTIGIEISKFVLEIRAEYGLLNIYSASGGKINTLSAALLAGFKI